MKRSALIASALLAAVAACTSAGAEDDSTGTAGARSYDIGSFDSISLGGQHDVIVAVGAAPSIRAEGDTRELDRLEVKVEDGSLNIGSKRTGMFSSNDGRRKLTIHVTVPSLAGVAIGGSGNVRVDKVDGRKFDGSIGGSGNLDVASLRVDEANFAVGGSGTIKAAGTAAKADISIAGSGNVETAGVEAADAKVAVAGSGNAHIRATRTADVSIVGSGDVIVDGSAHCSVSKMGSGELHCGA